MGGIPIKGTMRPARKPIKCKKAGGRACGINVNRRYIYVNTIKKSLWASIMAQTEGITAIKLSGRVAS